jgi:hypothetical protein
MAKESRSRWEIDVAYEVPVVDHDSGETVHTHHVVVFRGATVPTTEDVEREAIEEARACQPDARRLEVGSARVTEENPRITSWESSE